MIPGFLDQADYGTLIRCAPVLCVDVDLMTPGGQHVLFRRTNEPLKGELWVLGGRVHKGEGVLTAALRKLAEEAGLTVSVLDLRFVGFYEEVFEFSSLGRGKYHAVSLVYQTHCDPAQIRLDGQHSGWELADRLPNGFTAKTSVGGPPR